MLHGHEYLYPVFEYHSLNMCKLHVDLLFAKNLKFVLQSGNESNTLPFLLFAKFLLEVDI